MVYHVYVLGYWCLVIINSNSCVIVVIAFASPLCYKLTALGFRYSYLGLEYFMIIVFADGRVVF